ncbi:MAG: PEP-CTERM sorting domain-containing protein [Terriglobia bacterium]|jgi:hypothetical protein
MTKMNRTSLGVSLLAVFFSAANADARREKRFGGSSLKRALLVSIVMAALAPAHAGSIDFDLVSVSASDPNFLTGSSCCALPVSAFGLYTPNFSISGIGTGTMNVEYSFSSPDVLFTNIYAYLGAGLACKSGEDCPFVHADYSVFDSSGTLLGSTGLDFGYGPPVGTCGYPNSFSLDDFYKTVSLGSGVSGGFIDVSTTLCSPGLHSEADSGYAGALTYFAPLDFTPPPPPPPTPEPSTFVLFGTFMIGLVGTLRRKSGRPR